MATVQIPILFDVDNGTTTQLELFGEVASTDFFVSQSDFTMATGIAASALDCWHVGDSTDAATEKIFFTKSTGVKTVDVACDMIANALITGTLTQVNHASAKLVKGGGAVNDYFQDNIGTGTLGAQLAKIACIHLVGHPLAQAIFSNEQKIQDELLTQAADAAASANDNAGSFTDSAGATVNYTAEKYHTKLSQQLGTLLGGTAATATLAVGSSDGTDANAVAKAGAQSNAALKSIFEQLMNVAGRSNDIAGAKEHSTDSSKTTTAVFPFAAGDELVFYIRGKIKIGVESAVMGDANVDLVDSAGNALASASAFTNATATASTIGSSFPGSGGSTAVANKFNWMGATDNDTFGDNTTDLTDTTILDCHVLKITVTLT